VPGAESVWDTVVVPGAEPPKRVDVA